MVSKTVVITGSARGLGFEMAKRFRLKNFNVVISDINESLLTKAKKELDTVKGKGKTLAISCDVTKKEDVINLIDKSQKKFNKIDIWINNAGVNQPDKLIWEMDYQEIKQMLDIDLLGTINATNLVMQSMIKQNSGAIYTVEGHGSNDAVIPGLSIYGTAKRGVTYFVNALAKEAEVNKLDIIIGKLSPGIMITDFLTNSFGNKKMEISAKTKKIYNILGDYPSVVAKFLVDRMITNTNNNVRITWLTKRKVIWKFLTYKFHKEKKIK